MHFKTEIPGEGWSSPVILGKQVWVTSATDGGKSLRAICVDRDSGSILHDVELFHQEQLDAKNTFNSYASPTPALEPGRVYVSFGNYGNACLDSSTGKILWQTRELRLDHKEGPGSSPVLCGELLLLDCDGMDVQYLAALDKNSGHVAWKANRSVDFSHMPLTSARRTARRWWRTWPGRSRCWTSAPAGPTATTQPAGPHSGTSMCRILQRAPAGVRERAGVHLHGV